MSYKDAAIVQKHIVLAMADIRDEQLHVLTEHPDLDTRIEAISLVEIANDLASTSALTQVHVQR